MSAIPKPTLLRILFALSLFLLFSFLWRLYVLSTISDTFPWGFPLQFYLGWGPCPSGEICSQSNVFFLLLDLIFWYVISGIVVSKTARHNLPG
jgi:hypothetical protein